MDNRSYPHLVSIVKYDELLHPSTDLAVSELKNGSYKLSK